MNPPLRVEPVTAGDTDAVLALASAELGEGYLTVDNFRHPAATAYVARWHDQVVGFALSELVERHVLIAHYPKLGRMLDLPDQLGLLRSGVVDRRLRGRGVGLALVKRSVETLRGIGATTIVALAWKREHTVPSAGMLRAVGFEEVATIPALWSESSVKEQFTCPVCGPPPCRCDAIVYRLR